MRTGGFRQYRHRFFGKTVMHVVPEERSLEIDELADLRVAEILLRNRGPQKADALPDKISAVVFDFDGVFTDNRVLVAQDGSESVACNRGDGWALAQLRKTGLSLLVLSTKRIPSSRPAAGSWVWSASTMRRTNARCWRRGLPHGRSPGGRRFTWATM